MTDPHVLDLDAHTVDEVVGSAEVPVLVELWAEWCGPCHALAPVLAELATERDGSLVVAKCDTDANPGIARRYEALSIPTMLIFRDGDLVGRLVGARPKGRLAAEVDALLAGG